MQGATVSVQWTPDSTGTFHPPYLATVIGCNDDRSVTVRYHVDAVVETERLNNTVKFDNWTLLVAAYHHSGVTVVSQWYSSGAVLSAPDRQNFFKSDKES